MLLSAKCWVLVGFSPVIYFDFVELFWSFIVFVSGGIVFALGDEAVRDLR